MGNSDTLHFEITNLKVIVNAPCGSPLSIKTDIWGSNSSAPDPKAQCYICGNSQSFGEVTVSLQKSCTSFPFQYSLGLNSSSSTDFHVVFRLYADDLDGIREPNGDDSLLFVSDTIVLTPSSFSTGLRNLPGLFCCTEPFDLWGLYVDVTAREFTNVVSSSIIEPGCATTFIAGVIRSFTAARNNSTVLLKWETATEEKQQGFYIERNLSNNTWQTLDLFH
jgi:hypothetical protein